MRTVWALAWLAGCGGAADLESRVAALEAAEGDAELTDAVAALAGRVTALESTVATLQGRLDDDEDAIAALEATVGGVEGDVADLEVTVGDVADDVDDLGATVDAVETDVAGLDGAVTAVQGSVSGVQTSVGTLQTTVGGLSTTVDTLSASTATVEQAVAGLVTSVSDLATDLDDLAADLGDLDGAVADLQSGGGADNPLRLTLEPAEPLPYTYGQPRPAIVLTVENVGDVPMVTNGVGTSFSPSGNGYLFFHTDGMVNGTLYSSTLCAQHGGVLEPGDSCDYVATYEANHAGTVQVGFSQSAAEIEGGGFFHLAYVSFTQVID